MVVGGGGWCAIKCIGSLDGVEVGGTAPSHAATAENPVVEAFCGKLLETGCSKCLDLP